MIRGVVKLQSKDQISAAQELYRDEKMEYWRLEDETMARLRDQDSNMREQATTLIKATLVNSFYGARAGSRAIDNITSWLVAKEPDILREYHDLIDNEEVRIQFVQQIATYGRDKDIEGCIVFASKFAHFFIDPEAFPIYDQYACMMVNFHLGKSDKGLSTREKYTDFHKNFFQFKRYLEQEYHDQYKTKELDHYLWLSGMYVAKKRWDLPKTPEFYYAAEDLFQSDNPYLKDLFPQQSLDTFPIDLIHELPRWEASYANLIEQQRRKEQKDEKKRRKRN